MKVCLHNFLDANLNLIFKFKPNRSFPIKILSKSTCDINFVDIKCYFFITNIVKKVIQYENCKSVRIRKKYCNITLLKLMKVNKEIITSNNNNIKICLFVRKYHDMFLNNVNNHRRQNIITIESMYLHC